MATCTWQIWPIAIRIAYSSEFLVTFGHDLRTQSCCCCCCLLASLSLSLAMDKQNNYPHSHSKLSVPTSSSVHPSSASVTTQGGFSGPLHPTGPEGRGGLDPGQPGCHPDPWQNELAIAEMELFGPQLSDLAGAGLGTDSLRSVFSSSSATTTTTPSSLSQSYMVLAKSWLKLGKKHFAMLTTL